jgi:two-component system sensor histidine kinase CreC
VDDQGPGIPEFAQARLFEKFFSLERPDTGKKSTGLGLNFVKEVAALHGGSVEVTNLPERGLRARLVFPVT